MQRPFSERTVWETIPTYFRGPHRPFGKRSPLIVSGEQKKVTVPFFDYLWKKGTVPFLHIFEEFDALFDGRMGAKESVHLPFYIL